MHRPIETPRTTDLIGFSRRTYKQKEKDGDLLAIISKLQSSCNLYSFVSSPPLSLDHFLSPRPMGRQGEPEFRVRERGIMQRASRANSTFFVSDECKGEVACL